MQQISPQEMEIMKIVWHAFDEKLTARDIEERLAAIDGKRRNLSSLMTVLARLIDKGFLDPIKKYRKSTYFEALVQENEYKAYATRQFMDIIHDGELTSFASAILSGSQYTQQSIDEMLDMIDKERQK